jgi:hypothetical protein
VSAFLIFGAICAGAGEFDANRSRISGRPLKARRQGRKIPWQHSLFCERGTMAGNGRGMATERQKENQKRSTKASGTRRAAAKTGTPSTRKKPTSKVKEGAKEKTDADLASAKPGAGLLEDAADAVVKKQCEALAKGLMKAAIKGNASCAKMLVTLTEKVRTQKEVAKEGQGRSAANLLASEPEWQGAQEADSEVGSGANETETKQPE